MTDREPPARPTPSLEEVAARLQAVQAREAEKSAADTRRKGKAEGISIGMRIGIELLASVLVGGLGAFIDSKAHTSPIFLLALVSLGFTAGVMNVLRITKRMDVADHIAHGQAAKDATTRQPAPSADDED
jgi:ATP synthase protein I